MTAVLTELDAHGPNTAPDPQRRGSGRRPNDTATGVTIAHLMLGDQPREPDPAITDWLIDVAVHRGDTSPILLRRHDDMMEITEKRDPFSARWNRRGHARARHEGGSPAKSDNHPITRSKGFIVQGGRRAQEDSTAANVEPNIVLSPKNPT